MLRALSRSDFSFSSSSKANGFFAVQKARIEQNRVYKSTLNDIKNVIEQQNVFANKYDAKGLSNLYADDFVNSDGFNKDIYFNGKLILIFLIQQKLKMSNSLTTTQQCL